MLTHASIDDDTGQRDEEVFELVVVKGIIYGSLWVPRIISSSEMQSFEQIFRRVFLIGVMILHAYVSM